MRCKWEAKWISHQTGTRFNKLMQNITLNLQILITFCLWSMPCRCILSVYGGIRLLNVERFIETSSSFKIIFETYILSFMKLNVSSAMWTFNVHIQSCYISSLPPRCPSLSLYLKDKFTTLSILFSFKIITEWNSANLS